MSTTVAIPHIRLAHQGDEAVLMDMIPLLHKESGLRDEKNQPFPLEPEKCRETVYAAIAPDRMLYYRPTWIGIASFSGDIAGSVCLQITSPWYSYQEFLFELWNFVMPDYRKTGVAKLLIDFSKAVGDQLELDLAMGVMSTEREPAKMRFYERSIGVKPFGGFFLYNVKKAGK